MSYPSSWIGKAIALALVAVVGGALMTALGTAGQTMTAPGPGESAACAASYDRGHQTTRADALRAVNMGQEEDALEPAAVCRLRPECTTNEECDVRCGVGLGKCVHSNCPVRICRCS